MGYKLVASPGQGPADPFSDLIPQRGGKGNLLPIGSGRPKGPFRLVSPPPQPEAGKVIEVQAPDGSIVEFPADTSDDTMKSVMRRYYPPTGGASPDIPKIKRNIQRMIDQNAPESDIDAYVSSEEVTAEQLRAQRGPWEKYQANPFADLIPQNQQSGSRAALPPGFVLDEETSGATDPGSRGRGRTITIQGRPVTVSDNFFQLSPEEQDATVEEMASELGMTPAQRGGSHASLPPGFVLDEGPADGLSTAVSHIRAKYPQYSDMNDEQLLQGIHQKHYSDMPYDDFKSRLAGQFGGQGRSLEQRKALALARARQRAAEQEQRGPWEKYQNSGMGEEEGADGITEVHLPDGRVVQVKTTDKAVAARAAKLFMDKERGSMSFGDYAEDAVKSLGVGAVRGATQIAGMPGDAAQFGDWLGEKGAEALGLTPQREWIKEHFTFGEKPKTSPEMWEDAKELFRPAPTITDLVTGEKPASALDRQPQSTLGEYSNTAGEYLAGSFGPGGPLRKAAMTVVPAFLSETAGQVTKGTEAEPWARAGAGLFGGIVAAGRSGNVTKLAAQGAPTRQAVKAQADMLYDRLRSAGITYDANSYEMMARNLASNLRQAGFRGRTAKEAADTLDYVFEQVGTSPDFGDFAAIRENASQLLRSADMRERKFGGMIVDALDNFATRSPLITNGSVPANQVAPLMREARATAQRNIKARTVEEAIERARNAASGFENGLRVEFRKLLNSPKARAGFTQVELDAFKDIVRGTSTQNLAAQFGRLGIGIGTKTAKGALLPAIAGGSAGLAVDPLVGAGTVALASGVKYAAARNAEKVADRTTKLVLAGKQAQQSALQTKRAEQVKVMLRRALALDQAVNQTGKGDFGSSPIPNGKRTPMEMNLFGASRGPGKPYIDANGKMVFP